MARKITAIDHMIEDIITRMRVELEPNLTYHSVEHTLDVMEAVERIGHAEKVTDQEIQLLRLAAAYHDCGFLVSHEEHEKRGCEIFFQASKDVLKNTEIDMVTNMIMSTRIPQNPVTLLEKIICDADLDYLGRTDFDPISDALFKELRSRAVVRDRTDWQQLQIGFFETHRFWTNYSLKHREPAKKKRLKELKKSLRKISSQ